MAVISEGQPPPPPGRLEELRGSARGWHGVQLAVLGFIGLCGVLQREQSGTPTWLEVLSGLLALAALAVACFATYLVRPAAWPLYGPRRTVPAAEEDPEDVAHTSRRLKRGLLWTFVAVALLALAAASSWWPQDEAAGDGAAVEVQAGGRAFCGELVSGRDGAIGLRSGGQELELPLRAVSSIAPVSGCG